VPIIWGHIGEEIQTDGKLKIAGIEVTEMVRAPGWNVMQKFFGYPVRNLSDVSGSPFGEPLIESIKIEMLVQRSRVAIPA